MIRKYILSTISKLIGTDFKKEYLKIKSINNESNSSQSQEKHLENLLLHAYRNVPYYNRIFKEIGIVNNGTLDLSKFDKIPILTKKIIRSEKLISKDYKTRKYYYNSSGGSTGVPTKFIQDIYYKRWYLATIQYYYQDMLGIDEMNVKKIVLWGLPRDSFKEHFELGDRLSTWLTNTTFLNSFRMTKGDMERYIKIINSRRPDLIRGYASAIYEICKYAEEANLSIHTPKILVSSAETLRDEMREKIESVFGTKLYNFYGSRETASLAGECKCGLMHIFMFNNHIEILDNHDQPVHEGESGKIIVTNLHNYSMPFIRYEIGDAAVLGPKKCKCGNNLPTLKKVAGRLEENFIREDGNIVLGYFFVHLFGVIHNRGFISKFQVIQEDYKKIRILIVPEFEISDLEKRNIEDKIKTAMGKDCEIIWDFVEDIPKTKSGKYLYTKSFVWR